jgi:hypothetical protein
VKKVEEKELIKIEPTKDPEVIDIDRYLKPEPCHKQSNI